MSRDTQMKLEETLTCSSPLTGSYPGVRPGCAWKGCASGHEASPQEAGGPVPLDEVQSRHTGRTIHGDIESFERMWGFLSSPLIQFEVYNLLKSLNSENAVCSWSVSSQAGTSAPWSKHLHNAPLVASLVHFLIKPGRAAAAADVCYTHWSRLTNHNRVDKIANQSRLGFIRTGDLKETAAKSKCFRQRLKRGPAAMESMRNVFSEDSGAWRITRKPHAGVTKHLIMCISSSLIWNPRSFLLTLAQVRCTLPTGAREPAGTLCPTSSAQTVAEGLSGGGDFFVFVFSLYECVFFKKCF